MQTQCGCHLVGPETRCEAPSLQVALLSRNIKIQGEALEAPEGKEFNQSVPNGRWYCSEIYLLGLWFHSLNILSTNSMLLHGD